MKPKLAYWIIAASALSGCADVGPEPPAPPSKEGPGVRAQADVPRARLFAGGQEGATRGLHVWNDPDALGLDRAPDVSIEMTAPISLARVGERLFVLSVASCESDCELVLGFFDDPMHLDANASPSGEVHFRAPAPGSTDRLVAIPELDLLMFEARVFTHASSLTSEATPISVGWEHAAYDGATDRLFVSPRFGGEVSVIEGASTQPTPLEGSWLLMEGDSVGAQLAADEGHLYASRLLSGPGWRETVAWSLEAIDPSAGQDPYRLRVVGDAGGAAPNKADITALHPLSEGVVEGTSEGLVAWSGEAATAGAAAQTGVSVTDGEVLCLAVSDDGHVYAVAHDEGILAFDAEVLGEASSGRDGVFGALLLVEP